ncbi:Cobalt-factor III methyltransferase [anaerobic digester metagenome]
MPSPGRLVIVGIGPGAIDQMTGRARDALNEADCIIGNDTYLEQIRPLIKDKEVIVSRMGEEVDRARRAVALAREMNVAMVSGGDAGVYGMASIVLEVIDHGLESVPFEVVPGVTAANGAAALLGSPLSGDFCILSLSDLLTPLEVIERRLNHAFAMGVPVALYNPKSRGRPHNLALAIAAARRQLPGTVPVGVVRNAYRSGEQVFVTTLESFESIEDEVDMHAIVIIGNDESRIITWEGGNGIITPRGYHRKYVY